jgi:hypothetical protein
MDVLDVIVSAALSIGLTYTVVACDRLGLSPEQRARGWNSASTGSALIAFAPLCIVAHFWVTRRSLRGVLLGLLWLVVLVLLQLGLSVVGDTLGLPWLCALVVFAPMAVPLALPMLVAALL